MNTAIFGFSLLPICSLAWATPDLNKASDDACKCLEEPYSQAKKAMELIISAQTSGDYKALVSAQGEMMGILKASNQCFDALSVKYPEIDKSTELQNQVMKIVEEKCPNPAEAMTIN